MIVNIKKIVANFSYVLLSNFVTLVISSLAILIIPKLIGVEEYGFWQLYTFYIGYVGFFHLGWPDGIYLKFGGQEFKKLDRRYFTGQFVGYNIYLLVISIGVIIITQFIAVDINRSFIYFMTAINIVLMNVKTFFIWILQSTNKLKESSMIAILDRIIYAVILIALLSLRVYDYKVLIFADVIGKFLGVLFGLWICKDICLYSLRNIKINYHEIYDNIRVGINLMLSNIASMLIIGVIRLGIERQWDIATFGKVSLTLSISNMMMIFINAIGIVVFPILKRAKEEMLPIIYKNLRSALMVVMFLVLLGYYPIQFILYNWLPSYRESLVFMILVFPMAVFEGKMSLLINTYLKALRMEKTIFRVNVTVLMMSLLLTILLTMVLKNLELTISSIVVLLGIRSIIAEVILSKRLGIEVKMDILMEVCLTVIFIVTGWFLNQLTAMAIYAVCYLAYVYLKRNELKNIYAMVRRRG
ncbi:hypothetical protein JXA29_07085 [Aerococcaceae bacterium zg-BR33]|nr:hypothetical protein [Aerococcaceae bacterium zg-A91]MBS4458452.1 hypothetical protein [Aerococcaceae bacterium zg-BR33]